VPLSIELIAAVGDLWFVSYFRWHGDRNRLFFGLLDWSSDPAQIIEIHREAQIPAGAFPDGLRQLRVHRAQPT
jgi:hypothetical protein